MQCNLMLNFLPTLDFPNLDHTNQQKPSILCIFGQNLALGTIALLLY